MERILHMQELEIPKTFYPTPDDLIDRMLDKIKGKIQYVLEPSAGKGAICERLKNYYKQGDEDDCRWRRYGYRPFDRCDVRAIEIDPEFQLILQGKYIKVLDGDFLTYSGPDKFDLIIANPPFDHGDLHLLKAIDIMYCGEIVFLLNAETIKNPCTRTRQELVQKLAELGADIEFIPDAFKDAERPASVEVALIYINIERKVEDDLFAGCDDQVNHEDPELHHNYEVSTGKTVAELVAEYNQVINIGTETIVGYYKNYPKVWKYIGLNAGVDKYQSASNDLTSTMQRTMNDFLGAVRTDFWRRTLDIPEVTKRMTSSKLKVFHHQVQERCHMDFTENNIRQFILNIIDTYEETLMAAVLEVFKMMTSHSWSDGLYDQNIHYYNGWKTNCAFKVNKKLIFPDHYSQRAFVDEYNGKWKLDYGALEDTLDIDTVMNYFDAMSGYRSVKCAVKDALDRGQSKKIYSTYFTIDVFKKGTVHLTFNDDDIWRRFNVAASKGKNWLPHDYGAKAYKDMDPQEQAVVRSFEGVESYTKNLNLPVFVKKNALQIAA